MDAAKVELLFGRVPTWADPDDPEDRGVLLAEQGLGNDADGLGRFRRAMYEVIANQIADQEPPAVWATAQRLLGMGLDRRRVLHSLALTFEAQVQASLGEDRAFDVAAYMAALARLPLPTAEEVEEAMVAIVRDRQPIDVEELESLAMDRLGLTRGQEPFETLLDTVSDRAMDPEGPLALLAGDRVVEPRSLFAGIVLTHRLSEAEQATDSLTVGVDLAGFGREEPHLTNLGEALSTFSLQPGHLAWGGPEGWLRRFEAGSLLALSIEAETVSIDVQAHDVPGDPALVALVRTAYDTEVEEPWLPVRAEDLLLALLVGDRGLFAAPTPPLSELCEAAGLEIRGDSLAHEESVWENGRRLHRAHRVFDRLGPGDDAQAAMDVLDRFDEAADDPITLRRVLVHLREPSVLEVALDDMLGLDEDPERLEATAAFSERMLGVARRPPEVCVARLLAAVVAERRGDPLEGEAHLHLAAEADAGWGPAIDRLAWYASDRGDAAEAVRLLRLLGADPDEDEDLRTVEPFSGQSGRRLGRNEPCWCGSGRKFKACHLGRPELAPLPDRVGWLCRKAVAYLERRGGTAARDLFDLAWARVGDEGDDAEPSQALEDPLVIDLALHELGWFERFLAERGPLLPKDEALLADSWTLVDRTVYEVLRIDPGVGVEVQNLRTAERLEVRERTFSHRARPGMIVCGRAVPDGQTHQFIGGLFTVAPGTEAGLLDLLEEGDAFELVEYLAARERPPTLVTREGEPLVACVLELEVPEPLAARALLDDLYGADEPGRWVEMHALEGGEVIVRATLHLDGSRLSVQTMSEARADRVLSVLRHEIEGLRVISDERRPVDPRHLQRDTPSPVPLPLDDPGVRGALKEWRDRLEERWCDQPVPALAGLTPRQAAADPTRREAVERLLASFEDLEGSAAPEGAVTMRPARLRSLLGLDR